MTTLLLILCVLVLPVAMLFLSVSLNAFEKNAAALGEILLKRYHIAPPQKSADPAPNMQSIVKLQGRT